MMLIHLLYSVESKIAAMPMLIKYRAVIKLIGIPAEAGFKISNAEKIIPAALHVAIRPQ